MAISVASKESISKADLTAIQANNINLHSSVSVSPKMHNALVHSALGNSEISEMPVIDNSDSHQQSFLLLLQKPIHYYRRLLLVIFQK